MDRIAHTIRTAQAVRRQIWASLPWQVKLADFITRLAVSTTTAFGQAVYEEFKKKGLQVPEGRADFIRAGNSFGQKVYNTAIRKYRNPQFVEEVMMDFMVRFLNSGSAGLDPNLPVSKAENYVLRGVMNQAINTLKKKKEVSDIYFTSDGEELRHENITIDEDSMEHQISELLRHVGGALKRIHPDAALYVKLSLVGGHTDQEIIGDVANGVDSMLPHPYSKTGKPMTNNLWAIKYKPEIMEVLRKHFNPMEMEVHVR